MQNVNYVASNYDYEKKTLHLSNLSLDVFAANWQTYSKGGCDSRNAMNESTVNTVTNDRRCNRVKR